MTQLTTAETIEASAADMGPSGNEIREAEKEAILTEENPFAGPNGDALLEAWSD